MVIAATAINGSYDYRLVALSFMIALLTSYTALDLAGRVTLIRQYINLRVTRVDGRGWGLAGAQSPGRRGTTVASRSR